MSIAISEEHRALAQTVASFLTDHQSRAMARSLLGAETDPLPGFWAGLGGLGLLGLHVPAALGGEATYADGAATGKVGVVLSGHLADVLLVPAGDDVLVIETAAGGVQAEVPKNLDPSRRAARVSLDAAPATVLPGARGLLTGVARAVLAAE